MPPGSVVSSMPFPSSYRRPFSSCTTRSMPAAVLCALLALVLTFPAGPQANAEGADGGGRSYVTTTVSLAFTGGINCTNTAEMTRGSLWAANDFGLRGIGGQGTIPERQIPARPR